MRPVAPHAMVVTLGGELGGYQILSLLGEGGMGVVYRAYDPTLQRFVALKLLHERHTDNEARRRRLLREARSASALNHPHICTIYEVAEADGEAFMVMEFVEGPSLRGVIPPDGLAPQVALRYGIQIADALGHAHDRRIIHRDLKTSNVMVGSDSQVKVLDFGLATQLSEDDVEVSENSTATVEIGEVKGTLAYMAPEVLSGDAADARSDVWSLGVVLYETVTGTLPFTGRTPAELSATILRESPKPLPVELWSGLQTVILRCLSKDPAQRYRHGREVVVALEAVQGDASQLRQHDDRTTATVRQPWTAGWSRRLLGWRSITAALALVGLVGVFWWLASRERPLHATSNRLVTPLPKGSSAASFSPDGTMIVFEAAEADAKPQLWVKTLAQGEPRQITFGDQPATRACWSPKGDQTLFNYRGGIWSMPPLGGSPYLLIERASNPSFSSEGERIAYETADRGIWVANADGTDAHRLTSRLQPWEATPALSPDGRMIAYFQNELGPLGDFWVIPTSGGSPRQLTFDHTHGGRPAWTADSKSIIISSMRRGSENLWRVPVSGGNPETITFGAGQDRDPAVSADGRHLVYTNTKVAFALTLLDPATSKETELLERRSPLDLPRFSTDGKGIAFFQQVEADLQVFTVSINGQQLNQVTHAAGHRNLSPQWSTDDRFLFFTRYRPDVSFRKIPVEGGDSIEVGPWGVLNWPEIDRSGQKIIYERLDGAQPVATVIRDLGTGQDSVLERTLYAFRWWREKGSILGYDSSLNVVSCPPDSGACRPVARGHTPRPSGDGSRIFFLRPTSPPSRSRELWSVAADGRDEKRIGTLGPFYIDDRFDVSGDDRIVFVRYRESPDELWRAELQ